MIWEYDSLWQKAKLYAARALSADRNGPLFPFWASLSLELVGRATLAFVHPVLLADPQSGGESILYAFGYGASNAPKSLPIHTVLARCRSVVANFTEEDAKRCQVMMDLRNEELHTGSPIFEALSTSAWLLDYYRCCDILLTHQGKNLADLIGDDEAFAARKMLDSAAKQTKSEVLAAVGRAKSSLQQLDEGERTKSIANGSAKTGAMVRLLDTTTACPACGAAALIEGERVRATEPRLEDDMVIIEVIMLPKSFRCFSCGLTLSGHGRLHHAGCGGQYSAHDRRDPSDYYLDYFEPDEYGND